MKEEFTVSVSEDYLNKLLNKKTGAEDFIKGIFLDEENNEVLQTSCLYYRYHTSDLPEISHVLIDEVRFDLKSLAGTMLCSFALEHAYHSNKHNMYQEDQVKWYFTIDKARLIIQFVGEE